MPSEEQILRWRAESKRTPPLVYSLLDHLPIGRGGQRREQDRADVFLGSIYSQTHRDAVQYANAVEEKEAGISLVMWTDGSCLADGSTAAAVAYKMPHSRVQHVEVYEKQTLKRKSSNEAEMMRLTAALAMAVEMLENGGSLHEMGIGQMEMLTDSMSSLLLIRDDVERCWYEFRHRQEWNGAKFIQ